MTLGTIKKPSKLALRYLLAISLLIVFVLGGHGLHIVTSKRGALDEEILNISGRQRMLSQRIVLTAHRYNDTGALRYSSILNESLDLFEESNSWLATEALLPGTAAHRHYFGASGANLYQRSREFAQNARLILALEPGSSASTTATLSLQETALVDLLQDLNTAVTLFEEAANQRASSLEQIQFAVLLVTLLIIFLEVLLIFYPAHRALNSMVQRLRYQAWHDPLTGLINRAEFSKRVTSLTARNINELDRVVLFGLDLDGFKQINDTLGHPAGDIVLRKVATRINDTVGSFDGTIESHVSRVGGDEFLIAVLISGDDPALYAERLGSLLIEAVQEPISFKSEFAQATSCTVGVSLGFVTAADTKGDIENALGNADIALYQSKRDGKGRITQFTPRMRQEIENEHQVEQKLRVAIRGLEFKSFFQPQIDMQTGKIVGVEALARWDDPDRGIVSPAGFIEAAERLKLIDALDGQIALYAFQEYKRCLAQGIDLGVLSINTSGLALRDPDYCEILVKVAAAHNIEPKQVTLEVLENILVSENDPAIDSIRRLSKAGFGIAIDDFGVGFSSLARVGRMEISAIKIDRSLTLEADSQSMRKVLQATAAMAKGLDLKLLAEGIETEFQRQVMSDVGVQIGQGYYWSKPVSAEELCDWVRNEHRYRLVALK